jgi:serine/threonine protein kinase/DNA-binding LacI/PurR family transcriptional regulator
MPDPFIGRKVGDYELKSLLGQGGMAIVYLGYDQSLKRNVAVKIVSKLIAQDPTFLERFNREVALAARLQHPHIVPVFGFGTTEDGLTYLAMRHVQGGSLADRLREGPVSMTLVKKWFGQIADALEYAHGQNIIHRDIKPSNILIDDSNNAYLVDFGLARVVDLEEGRGGQLTKSSTFMGTPLYMSPEQIEQKALDKRSDLYSLGIVLWELVMGQPPFMNESTFRVMQMHLTEQPQSPRRSRPGIPPELDQMLLKSVEKNLTRRYQTAREMAEAFDAALGSYVTSNNTLLLRSSPARTSPLTGAFTGRYARRNRGIAAMTVALLAVILIGGLVVIPALQSNAPKTPTPGGSRANVLPANRPLEGTIDTLKLTEDDILKAPELFRGSFLGIVACSLGSEYHASYVAAARARAQDLGITVELKNSDTQKDKQPSQVNELLALGARGIVLCVLDAESTLEVRNLAGKTGIPIAANDETVTVGGVAFTAKNEDMGRTAGEYAAKYITANMGGKANIMVLNYPDLPQIVERENAILNAIKAGAPEAKVVASYLGGTEDNGVAAMKKALEEHPEINFIVTINDAGALGAVRVLREAGVKPSDVSIVGIDAVAETRRLIRTGEYFRASVDTSATVVGRAGVDAIVKLLNGSAIPQVIRLPMPVVDRENVDKPQ